MNGEQLSPPQTCSYENEAWLVLRVASCGGGESGRGHTAHRSPDTRTEGYTVVTRDTGPAGHGHAPQNEKVKGHAHMVCMSSESVFK